MSPENPLIARVFVNRVWQFHFGEGIVRTVDDFGAQGARPTHPELLDYLAVTFREHNWDLKWLTKQIMMSQVYRQGSEEVPQYLAADPGDKLLWRRAPLRLEAETIRDSMLKISGLLNQRMFGKQEPIKRDAFLYLPAAGGDKQCSSCWLFNAEVKRCKVLAKDFEVEASDSCGYWGPVAGEQDLDVVAWERFTPEEVGFVKHAVRCENCHYFDDGRCGLFFHLNATAHKVFDLDERVDAKGCCNAQTPKV